MAERSEPASELPTASPRPDGTDPPVPHPGRSVRVAAYLAQIFGVLGLLAGAAGALTFLPYRTVSTYHAAVAGPLTVIATVGTAASIISLLAGRRMLRSPSRAYGLAELGAAGSVGAVIAMTAFWPEFLPFALLAVVGYGLEMVLLAVGRGSVEASLDALRRRSRSVGSSPFGR